MNEALTAYLEAKCRPTESRGAAEHHYSRPAVEAMQRAIRDALRSGEPLPGEIRGDLAHAFEELCAGSRPELLAPVPHPGGRQRPIAKALQAAAIRYLRWVAEGRIDDPRPIATVVKAYGVTRRTVHGWVRAWKAEPTPPLAASDAGPAARRIERKGKPRRAQPQVAALDDAQRVREMMTAVGRSYARFVPPPKPRLPR
jgi:hypothetical protein